MLIICYFIVFIINWLSKRVGISRVYGYLFMLVVGVSIVTYQLNFPYLNNGTGRGYSAFFLGMLLWQLYKTVPKKVLIVLSALALFFCSVAIILNVGIDNQWGIFTFMIWPSLIMLFILLEPIFKHRLFGLLGEVSFEMYVWHTSGIFLFVILKESLMEKSYPLKDMIVFTLIVIIVSSVMYLFVEKPITAYLKNKLVNIQYL